MHTTSLRKEQTPFVPLNLPGTTNTEVHIHVRLPHAACAEHEMKKELIVLKRFCKLLPS